MNDEEVSAWFVRCLPGICPCCGIATWITWYDLDPLPYGSPSTLIAWSLNCRDVWTPYDYNQAMPTGDLP